MDMNLNYIQLDALKEVGNIGAGNAATALSQLINRKVEMSVPEVDLLPFEKMIGRVGQEDDMVVAVLLKVFGDAPGNILFTMPHERSLILGNVILKDFGGYSEEIFISMFQEIGNIVGNAFVNAIGMMTGLNMLSTIPAVAVDMLAAVLSTSFLDAEQYNDLVLAIDTNFIENERESGGNIFYIPKPGSLNKILEKLGL